MSRRTLVSVLDTDPSQKSYRVPELIRQYGLLALMPAICMRIVPPLLMAGGMAQRLSFVLTSDVLVVWKLG